MKNDTERGLLGAWARKERLALGLSVEQVVTRLSDRGAAVDPAYIRAIESGSKRPRLDSEIVDALAAVYKSRPEPEAAAAHPHPRPDDPHRPARRAGGHHRPPRRQHHAAGERTRCRDGHCCAWSRRRARRRICCARARSAGVSHGRGRRPASRSSRRNEASARSLMYASSIVAMSTASVTGVPSCTGGLLLLVSSVTGWRGSVPPVRHTTPRIVTSPQRQRNGNIPACDGYEIRLGSAPDGGYLGHTSEVGEVCRCRR